MKLSSLTTKVKECVLKQQTYLHQPQEVNEFGQNRLQLTIEDEEGKKRKINCGTEKCKHKSKNHRTAGNLVKISTESI